MHAGGFSASEIHSWLGSVLPSIPQHLPSSSSSSSNYLLFKQQENGTLLGCVYGTGQATFLWYVPLHDPLPLKSELSQRSACSNSLIPRSWSLGSDMQPLASCCAGNPAVIKLAPGL